MGKRKMARRARSPKREVRNPNEIRNPKSEVLPAGESFQAKPPSLVELRCG
jgi:hypothetical protein